MGENLANRLGDARLGPVWMLALNEGGLVPAHGPVKPVRGAPSLFRRQAAERGDLFRTRLFVFVLRHRSSIAAARLSASEIEASSTRRQSYGGQVAARGFAGKNQALKRLTEFFRAFYVGIWRVETLYR
jgi:hypothetical protein